MKRKNTLFWITIIVLIAISFLTAGCENPESANHENPVTITITGIPDTINQPSVFISIFDDAAKIIPQNALADGSATIKNGRAEIDLRSVGDQPPLENAGNYYVELMFGESRNNPAYTYFYVGSNTTVKNAFEVDIRGLVDMMTAALSDPPTESEIKPLLMSLEMLGGIEGAMEMFGAEFIQYENLKDNITIDLNNIADVTTLLNFAKILGLA